MAWRSSQKREKSKTGEVKVTNPSSPSLVDRLWVGLCDDGHKLQL